MTSLSGLQSSLCRQASAKPAPTNKEVDDASSAYIQGLVAKSKENKEKYDKDRLNDYYKRNFKVGNGYKYCTCTVPLLAICKAEQLHMNAVHVKFNKILFVPEDNLHFHV